jgi:hypothetical protein
MPPVSTALCLVPACCDETKSRHRQVRSQSGNYHQFHNHALLARRVCTREHVTRPFTFHGSLEKQIEQLRMFHLASVNDGIFISGYQQRRDENERMAPRKFTKDPFHRSL